MTHRERVQPLQCKTVITAMLTVMSAMNPHIICGNLGWVLVMSWLGCVEVDFFRLWFGHGETRDAIEVVVFEEMSSLLIY
jgi:hypothetical protein